MKNIIIIYILSGKRSNFHSRFILSCHQIKPQRLDIVNHVQTRVSKGHHNTKEKIMKYNHALHIQYMIGCESSIEVVIEF